MKKTVLAALFSVAAFVCLGDRADNPVLRIMPLGDSITYGSCSESGGGYRAFLWQKLTNGNYNVDFVGTRTDNPRKDGSLGDIDHQGIGGWKLSSPTVGVYEHIKGWFATTRDPHVILLHLGTNDTGDGETTFCGEATNRLVRLLDRIHECQPSAKIVVTTLLRRIGSQSNIDKFTWIARAYNPFIEGIVADQRAKGQDAYFLDMCSAVTDDGLYTDGLHPKDTGYSMMADTWYAKIQEIIPDPTACGGVNAPSVVDTATKASLAGTQIVLHFNQPMDPATLADTSKWTVTGATAAWTVAASADNRAAVFSFLPEDFGKTVTVAGTGLATADTPAATCDVAVRSFMITRAAGVENNVSAAARAGYELVYDIDIPSGGTCYRYNNVAYKTDRHAQISAFSRVAYYLELQKSGGDVQYVWASMDAFTDDAGKIGVPVTPGVTFQKDVANLFLESNVAGLRTGQTIPTGNIEFWPDSYKRGNKRGLAGADADLYDHDDTPDGAGTAYGSMQLHDTAQGGNGCVFAWNRFQSGTDKTDLGIGTCTAVSSATDWTQTYNSDSYTLRHLQVYVLPGAATVAPTLVSATRDAANRRLTVTFSTPVADMVLDSCFTLSGGRITGVSRDAGNLSVVYVDYMPEDGELALTAAGVREASSALLPMAAAVTVTPTVGGLPQEISSAVGSDLTAGYDVIYQVDIPATHVNWLTAEEGHTAVPFTVNRENDYPVNVDRVAYFLELRGNSGCKYVWVSMDAFSPDLRKLGIPYAADRAVKQQWVKNMDVKSNVSGIVNGTGMDGGFIEFWHMNYSSGNVLGIPGASNSVYDFGDSMSGNGNYGCMQVHSVTNGQTLFAFNNFGKNNSNPSCIGIGNDTYKTGNGVNPDWTFHSTANEYTSRRLWILARPGRPKVRAPAPATVVEKVPAAADFNLLYELTLPASGMDAKTPASYTSYHAVDNRALFGGAKPARVGYLLELVDANNVTNWCWTAFDAFTTDLERYSLPTNYGRLVQQRVANLDVRSNHPGVTEVTGAATGNIEFFPLDYSQAGKLGLANAKSDQFDFDDAPSAVGGYGCMQVHNWGAKQTCWAVNHLNAGTLDIGIGNYSATKTDWTQTYTGAQYTSRRLYVLLQFADGNPVFDGQAAFRRLTVSRDRRQICLEFASEPSTDYDGAVYEIQTVRNGATVQSVTRSPFSLREYILTLTRSLDPGTSYTLSGTIPLSVGAWTFRQTFTTPADAPGVTNLTTDNIAELNEYVLVNEIELPASASITANGANYLVDESRFVSTPFDRVAWYLETETSGTNAVTQWGWVSMDAYTTDLSKVGLPSVTRDIFFQKYVENLSYASGSSSGAAPFGSGAVARGNVEIWPGNYRQANNAGIPGASGGTFDFGDEPNEFDGLHAGHGSFQVHDYQNQRVLIAISCLNGYGGLAIGLGNDTYTTSNGLNPDWTHHGNASQFAKRRLLVFVRPVTASTGPAFDREPEDATVDVGTATELVATAPGAVRYQWLVDGVAVAGATGPVLRLAGLSEGAHTCQAVAVFADGTQTLGRTTTLTAAWPASAVPQTIRIMPLGDSITHGVMGDKGSYQGGYRQKLYEKLTAAHYSVDFVGSTTVNSAGMADPQHEGHSGWWISHDTKGLYENILDWFGGILNPHVVLVHIGTNDTGGGEGSFATAIDRLDLLIDRIADAQPGAVIIVSTLLERSPGPYALITKHFNPYVRERVLDHQAKGQKVRFLDMNAYVPLSDMADQLHPGEVGYEKMAQGWFDAIVGMWPTAMDVEVDDTPGILTISANQETRKACTVAFNAPVDVETATNTANWAVTGGTVASVSLSSDKRSATATFAVPLPVAQLYTLTVTGVMDAGRTAAMPATSREFYLSIPQGIAHYVPAEELARYEQVYSIDLLAKDAQYDVRTVKYAVDNHLKTQPFKRVAYYMELRMPNANLQYVWVSMDAFTDDAGKIGVPTFATQAKFQQKVTNMKILSNAAGIIPGERAEGSIEFWATSYDKACTLGLAGASASDYDFDDTPTSGGYGSMQVHDFLNGTTLFSYGRWSGFPGSAQDLGVGNCPMKGAVLNAGTAGSDWTFCQNSAQYDIRHLEVWTMPDVAAEKPVAPVSARRTPSGCQVVVAFDGGLDTAQKLSSCFTLSDGTAVSKAELISADAKTVRLTCATPAAAEGLSVTVAGVRADNLRGSKMTAPVTLDVADYVPASLKANVGTALDGYQLVYDLNVPVKTDWNAKGLDAMYDVNETKHFSGAYDRVGYYFELVKANWTTQYVWVAFQPHVSSVDRLGVPIPAAGIYFQQYVQDMEVKSNVSGITSGSGYTQGNIEMWCSDYSQGNALGIVNANAGTYDFGDTRSGTDGGYGSFQVHNAGQRQVLFAINNWGTDGRVPCVGIGSQTSNSSNLDWTFNENARDFLSRRLYVFVRPNAAGVTFAAPASVRERVAAAADYEHVCTVDIPVKAKFSDAGSNTLCHVVDNRTALETAYGRAAPKRIAYLVELVSKTGGTNWVWTAMDAFTNRLDGISVPRGCVNWRRVDDLDVESNVAGVPSRTGVASGCIEFCSYNYSAASRLGLGGSASGFDYDDTPGSSGAYGCMQVHDWSAKQTLWALNNFNSQDGDSVCIGIGNNPNPSGAADYTHVFNGANWAERRLYVFARWNLPEKEPYAAASFRRAIGDTENRAVVCATFDGAVSDAQAARANFSSSAGTIVAAAISPTEPRDVMLTFDEPFAADTSVTVTYLEPVTGVSVARAFTTPPAALPDVLAQIDEAADYVLVNDLPLPTNPAFSGRGANYRRDMSRFRPGPFFDRIAYCLELVGTNGVSSWAWTSMDAFTSDLTKIGLPSVERDIFFQQYVNDLHVRLGTTGAAFDVTAGDYARGNIEFWPGNYSEANQKSIPGASAAIFDFGDMAGADARRVGYGSMQVHATDQGRTVWAVNAFGSSAGPDSTQMIGLGIGSSPNTTKATDWTFVHNADQYRVRNLYVLVRPFVFMPDPAAFLLQPESRATRVGSAPFQLAAYAKGAVSYRWRRDGESLPGVTGSYCEVDPARAGTFRYDVVATFEDGTVAISEPAVIEVFTDQSIIIIR